MDNHDLEVPFHELPGKDDDDDQMESHQHEEEEEEGGGGGMGDEEATEREFFCFPELSEENPFTTNKALIVPKVKKAGDKESVLGTPKEEELSTSSSMSLLMSESRRCVICDKQFISGKALGGHMRIHAQFHKFKGDHLGVKKVHHHHRRNLKFQYHHDFPKAKKSIASSNDFPDLMRNKKPTCSLCNKSFPSMKSLFGHMRCHPEREWRGMQPPAAAARNSSSSTLSDAITRKTDDQIDSTATTSTRTSGSPVDLLQSISGWSVTAKRGRKTSTSAPETDNQILDTAVYSLMLLGCADNRNLNASYPTVVELETDCESPAQSNLHGEIGDRDRLCDYYILSKTKKRKVEQTKTGRRLNSRSEMQEIDERDTGNTQKWAAAVVLERTVDREDSVGFEFVVDKSNDTDIQGHRQEEEEVDAAEKNESGTKLKRKRRMMKLRDLQSEAGSTTIDAGDGKYRCSTCHRCFPTYQALGGHRSSHYNFRNSFVEESDANAAVEREQNFEGAEAAAAGLTASAAADTRMAISTAAGAAGATTTISTEAAAAAHLCTICNKSFPSGQALGGHKRCHWAGSAESSAAASSPGELGTETERRILGFDLNELPAVEEEDPAETEAALSQFGDRAATTYLLFSSHNSAVT